MISTRPWLGYACAVAAAIACTFIGLAMTPRFDIVNIAMVYLLAVVAIAVYSSRGAAVLGAALSVAAFDVVFVPPQGTFSVEDVQYLLTFAIMVAVALIISGLIARVRSQAMAQADLSIEAETQRIRSTLLASISHDLRTPLAVLSGASSTLAETGERLGADERRALAQSIYAQARDMSEQVAKILQMTRLETGTLVLERDWVALGEIAASVQAKLAGQFARHRLMVELPADLPLVRVDAILVEQVLFNLLENAARHTPEGTVVRLRARPRDSELVVSVEDFGPGLADADVERVFAMFHRGVSEGATSGVGLGLAICRAIIRLHGGEAWAETLPGGGTAFRFTLPLEAPPPMPQEAG